MPTWQAFWREDIRQGVKSLRTRDSLQLSVPLTKDREENINFNLVLDAIMELASGLYNRLVFPECIVIEQ